MAEKSLTERDEEARRARAEAAAKADRDAEVVRRNEHKTKLAAASRGGAALGVRSI